MNGSAFDQKVEMGTPNKKLVITIRTLDKEYILPELLHQDFRKCERYPVNKYPCFMRVTCCDGSTHTTSVFFTSIIILAQILNPSKDAFQ